MALSRWSHSVWYIYLVETDTVQIEGYGSFTADEILNEYGKISIKVKNYSLLDQLELYLYINTWAKAYKKQLDGKKANKIIDALCLFGEIRRYTRDPWKNKVPRELQIHMCPPYPVSDRAWKIHLTWQKEKAEIQAKKLEEEINRMYVNS